MSADSAMPTRGSVRPMQSPRVKDVQISTDALFTQCARKGRDPVWDADRRVVPQPIRPETAFWRRLRSKLDSALPRHWLVPASRSVA